MRSNAGADKHRAITGERNVAQNERPNPGLAQRVRGEGLEFEGVFGRFWTVLLRRVPFENFVLIVIHRSDPLAGYAVIQTKGAGRTAPIGS